MGPIILVALGLGSVGFSYLSVIAPYRPVFVIITGASLMLAHWRMDQGKMSPKLKVFLWVATGFSLLMMFLPAIIAYF